MPAHAFVCGESRTGSNLSWREHEYQNFENSIKVGGVVLLLLAATLFIIRSAQTRPSRIHCNTNIRVRPSLEAKELFTLVASKNLSKRRGGHKSKRRFYLCG